MSVNPPCPQVHSPACVKRWLPLPPLLLSLQITIHTLSIPGTRWPLAPGGWRTRTTSSTHTTSLGVECTSRRKGPTLRECWMQWRGSVGTPAMCTASTGQGSSSSSKGAGTQRGGVAWLRCVVLLHHSVENGEMPACSHTHTRTHTHTHTLLLWFHKRVCIDEQ